MIMNAGLWLLGFFATFMQVKDLNTFSTTDYIGYITDKSEKSAISAE